MRVAAIYDIHGNLPALEALLALLPDQGVTHVVVGGDVVPGPFPLECLARLRELEVPVHYLHGNGEVDVVATARGEVPTRVPEAFHPVMRWVADRLTPAQVEELASWPRTVELELPELGEVLFCHATPTDEFRIFTRLTPEPRVRTLLGRVRAATLLCGHTHMPFRRLVDGVEVVNPGSVGMPFGETGAHWALLSEEGVALQRTTYDLEAAMERIRESGYPGTASFDLRNPPSEEVMLERFEAAAGAP